jgi:hypothetical protein
MATVGDCARLMGPSLVRRRGAGLVAAEARFQLPESRERHEGKRLRRDGYPARR